MLYVSELFSVIHSDLQDHYLFGRSKGPKVSPYSCESCGRSYCRKEHLRRHQTYECGKEPQFQCPFCSKRAKHKANLQQHMIICKQRSGNNITI